MNVWKKLKRSFSAIEKFVASDNGSTEYKVISENFYIISKKYSSANVKGKRIEPLYGRIVRYLGRNSWKFEKNGFIEFFISTGFTVSEIYMLQSALASALIISAADEISAFDEKRRMNGSKLISSVTSLHKIFELRTDECFEKLCPTEKLIESVTNGYSQNDGASRHQCREALIKYAQKTKMSEADALTSLVSEGKSVYDLLVTGKNKRIYYFAVYAFVFAVISFLSFGWFGLLSFFLLIPLYETAGMICDMIFSHCVKASPPLRLGLDEVPDDSKVLCVTVSLLFGRENDAYLFDRLESFYLKNKKKNVFFGILADFPDSKEKLKRSDKAAAFYASERIKELNEKYGNVFVLLIRDRELSKSDGRYMGRERKRGAVCDLVEYITGGKNAFSVTVNDVCLADIKYVLTLDSDTILPINGVLDLLNTALHPANRPEIKNGRVVKGHGIFQPKMKTGLIPSYSTYYSLLESEEGGFYESASFDRYQSLFGSGMFCGKGMFDVGLFKDLVIPAFPENRILSHDIPEGCILRCMYVPDIVFTDSGPKNAVSSFKRLHRWIRGDMQNAYFLSSSVIDGTGKYKIAENIVRHLTPLVSVLGIFTAALFGKLNGANAVLFFFLSESSLILPSLFAFINRIFGKTYTPRRFFSISFTSFFKISVRLAVCLSSVIENAYRSADALVRTVWRTFVSKKRLLEWVTFTQSDGKGNGFMYHVSELIASSFAGVILFAFSKNFIFSLFGAITFIFPFLSYSLSFVIPEKTVKINDEYKKEITGWARGAFGFFDERVGEKTNFLPPDNVQLSPSDKTAERTSPTNIGLYLLSLIAFCDFGFITRSDAVQRITAAVGTVEKMKKYHGHLYNWYDTRSLDVIGTPYVSTVDSGNFVTMLTALYESLCEFGTPDAYAAAERVKKIADETDFSFLYDKGRRLMSLGFSEKNGLDGICYDMLMSEVRTICYYLCACGTVPKETWYSMSREVTEKNGYIGMISWSGSAFEYFMPELLLGTRRNSFIDESLGFVLYNQKNHKKNGLWGASESAYYAFDADMNYQYKAHGVPDIALKKYPEKEFVVSPYSVFLMLGRDPALCVKELEEMAERGMYGRYGFYESLDLTDGSEIIKSYMSHHVGMTVIASANACFDNVFVKRFMRDKRMESASELLDERIPSDVKIYKKSKISRFRERGRADSKNERSILKGSGVIRNGNAVLIFDGNGRISMRYGTYSVNECDLSGGPDEYGVSFGVICPSGSSVFPSASSDVSVIREKHGISLVSGDPVCPAVVKAGISGDGKCFVFNVKSDSSKETASCLYFRPVLDKIENFNSHRAYSKLFVISEYIEDKGIIVFRRKGRPGDVNMLIGVALSDPGLRFVFRTNDEHLNAHSRRIDGNMFNIPFDGVDGICINPACYVKTEDCRKNDVTFLVVPSYGIEDCISSVEKYRKDNVKCCVAQRLTELAEYCVSKALTLENIRSVTNLDTSALWRFGISGDVPLLMLFVYGENVSAVTSFVTAFRTLTTSFIRCELLFIINEAPSYSSPLSDFVKDCVSEIGCERFIGKRHGIYLVNASALSEAEKEFIKQFSSVFHETDMLIPDGETEKVRYKKIITSPFSYPSERTIAGTVSLSGIPPLPCSFVLAGYGVGTVLDSKDLGFTFYKSAHDRRIGRFVGDPYTENCGEQLLALTENGIYDLVSISDRAEFRTGKVVYYGTVEGTDYTVTVCVSPGFPVKLVRADFYGKQIRTAYRIRPSSRCGVRTDANKAFFKGVKKTDSSYTSFITCIGNGACMVGDEYLISEGICRSPSYVSCVNESSDAMYLLGAAPDMISAEKIMAMFDRRRFENECKKAVEFASSFLPPYGLYTNNGAADSLYSVFSPYQTAFSRYLAKTGFYQTGGAFGFRDQLQDCLCLVYSRPDIVKTHLYRCAAHQYREGDVMHWWFADNGKSRGIRSRCSDDLLFLPFVCSDYVRKTEDTSVLTTPLPYMYSPPLETSERFETPEYYGKRESLYMHCLRTIFRAFSLRGVHGLCLIGSCDWNDGISAAGEKGKGESVFTTLFLALTVRSFIPICEYMKDFRSLGYLTEIYKDTVKAVNDLWNGDRFPRGTFDDGTFFGVEKSDECKTDLLSQSFAAIVMGKTERTVKAMQTAYERLYDKEKKVFRLFDPPFDKIDAGYISAYPHGIRENGGQYTHGALWGVWGLASVGEYEKSLDVLDSIMPYSHTGNDKASSVYKVESYVIAADIYSDGRGGWSWYTGSAAWYFRIMTEVILGMDFTNGFNTVTVKPLKEYTLITERNGYKLKIISSKREKYASLDGSRCAFPLDIPKGEHILKLPPIY